MGLWPAVLEGQLFFSLVFTFCLLPPGGLISLASLGHPMKKAALGGWGLERIMGREFEENWGPRSKSVSYCCSCG